MTAEMTAGALPDRFTGRRVLVIGRDPLADAMAGRLRAVQCTVEPRPLAADTCLDADAILSVAEPGRTATGLAAQIHAIADLAARRSAARRLVVVVADGSQDPLGPVAARMLETLTIYATVHTCRDDFRINALVVPPRPSAAVVARLGDVALMLLSGLLDAMRGQTLRIGSDARGLEAVS